MTFTTICSFFSISPCAPPEMIHKTQPEPVLITNQDKWDEGTASMLAQQRVKKVWDYTGPAETKCPLATQEAIWSRAETEQFCWYYPSGL